MAKFRRGNLDLNTNKKVRLGDSLESEIYFDSSSQLKITVNGNEVLAASTGIELSHDDIKVFETDSTGVIIHGDIQVHGQVRADEVGPPLPYTDFQISNPAPEHREGRVFWDSEANTFGVYNDVPEVILQVGQETHIKIRNETGSLIQNGDVCYISGASQGRALVELAIATSLATSEGLVVITHDLDHNEDGYGTVIGMVRNVPLCDNAYEGATIYLSDTEPGGRCVERPDAPNYVTDIGTLISVDGTMGDILVQIVNHGDFESLADVNIPTTPTNGQTLVYKEEVPGWEPETQLKTLTYSLPLSGVTDDQVPLTGTFITKATGQTGDVATDFSVSNQHLFIKVNTATITDATASIIISGASVDESTGLPTSSDTETIMIDGTGNVYYQTDKKWWEVTNIDIDGGISAINYDYGVIGYPDLGNRDFKIIGYRMDAFASGVNPEMRFIITGVEDIGDNKFILNTIEDIGVDSGGLGDQIIDHLRTGGDDRSFDPAVTDIWANNETLTFKQLDLDDYWTNNENHILGSVGNNGFIIRIEGEPAGQGISNVDYITLYLYYALL